MKRQGKQADRHVPPQVAHSPVQRESTRAAGVRASTPANESDSHDSVGRGGRPTPIRTASALPTEAMNHDRSDAIMPQPLCPACGQPATQQTVRHLSDTEREGVYCDGPHLWITKWFAAVGA